jgi:hypothetical protein
MVAVQRENTADVDDYQLKTSTFYEMSTYALQEEVIEETTPIRGTLWESQKA